MELIKCSSLLLNSGWIYDDVDQEIKRREGDCDSFNREIDEEVGMILEKRAIVEAEKQFVEGISCIVAMTVMKSENCWICEVVDDV